MPVPGWAEEVVHAGGSAYVVGWGSDNTGALWHLDSVGRLDPRAAPPGMPGNPGMAPRGAVLLLAFGGAETGLAITGTSKDNGRRDRKALYVTDDGARSWTRVDLPTSEQPRQVAIGGGAAYALTSNCPAATAPCDHATLWSIDPSGAAAPHTFDSLPARTHTSGPIGITAYGPDVWALLNLGHGHVTALRSRDGGRTWHRFEAADCIWEVPVATSGNVLWATCGTGMLDHSTRQKGDAAPADVFSDVAGTSDSALLPLSDSTAYAVIDGSHGTRIEQTRDGGRTTTVVAPIPRPIARRGFRATFVSPRVGYLVTTNGGQVYRTADGAHTWHRLTPPHG
ncbi:MAG TPA: hypothetical protein VFJ19_18670 [Nocardioidaceae bacterium]|nr:hypothetical protein [Nocardioidaceae bacterium]